MVCGVRVSASAGRPAQAANERTADTCRFQPRGDTDGHADDIACEKAEAVNEGRGVRSPNVRQQVAADARQQVVVGQCGTQRVGQVEAGLRARGEADRHGAVQAHDRRREEAFQGGVERRDLSPVGVGRRRGLGVADRDRRLQHVRPGRAAGRAGPEHRREAAADQQSVPAAAILLVQLDR
jgi:hypothetical protein